MKKGIYFIDYRINLVEPDGIEKKILSQFKMFCQEGIDMRFELLEEPNGVSWNYKKEYSKVDFIYFRKQSVVDWRFISFFKKIKNNGNTIIFVEIPTFPYEGEFGSSLRSRLALLVDHYFRKQLKFCIDRIVVTGLNMSDTLWRIKTINIVNGIDLSVVRIRSFISHGDIINLTCVAKFSPWHGYERLLLGLASYYKNGGEKKIQILMVGPEKKRYEDIAYALDIGKYVRFLGKLTGEKLDEIYNITDIGICSLGRYKSGIDIVGDLKSRDLMAKGIPMLCGCKIDILIGREYKYAYYANNDASDIDIKSLVDYYNELRSYESVDSITTNIRNEAENLIDYGRTFQDVIKNVKTML